MDSTTSETRSPIIASWILLIGTCVLAIVPYFGFLAWILGGVSVLILIVLGVVVISKGATWHGILILMATLVVLPIVVFLGPIISSLITSAALDNADSDPTPVIEGAAEEPASESATEANPATEQNGPEASDEAQDSAGEDADAATPQEAPN